MSPFTLQVDIKEIINKMPVRKRIQLVRELEKETWAQRLDDVTSKIRQQVKHIPSEEEITELSQRARKKVYEKYKGRY